MCWFRRGLSALPVALVIWSSATLLLSYATAVVFGHADLIIPYISDTGTEVPERCVFGFMLSISAFLGLGTMYVRYKQVQALISASESVLPRMNNAGLLLGIFSCVGMCVVANFQGFVAHHVSAASEWSLAFSFISFFLTYTRDFQKINLRVQPVLHSNHLYHHYPHYEGRECVQHGERSPLLAGAI
ncbi:DNA damage-regulated autophagy modulator protein 2 [Triplophysa tibetana]|uniref:DNA damage-regulated autophagy modulator protein 2 n=1 Tax=Triplophysa tibetana TaxID=1572043 RepID=A0A5A9NXG3_9TELE|nr:DNA damage-regulated autophagy modulator protein 2 [Triplophysa tibetana]